MEFAVELMYTSRAFHTMICNRLEVICHEDFDTLGHPMSCRSSPPPSHSRWSGTAAMSRISVSRACMSAMPSALMCRSPKSREGDHFAAAIGWAAILEGFVPVVPDWALDQHTDRRQTHGARPRSLPHGRYEVDAAADRRRFIEEAYRLWALKAKQPKATGELF